MGWACGAFGWGEGVYRVLVRKPEGRRPLGRPRRRWVDIRMDLQDVGCGYMGSIGLAQDRDRWRKLVSAVMNFRLPWNAGNFLTSCKPVSFSRRTLHHGVSKKVSIPQNSPKLVLNSTSPCFIYLHSTLLHLTVMLAWTDTPDSKSPVLLSDTTPCVTKHCSCTFHYSSLPTPLLQHFIL